MQFAEVVINAPLRRRSARMPTAFVAATSGAGALDGAEDAYGDVNTSEAGITPESGERAEDATLQAYHYHLPADLEDRVQAGHLVWAPFGKRTVQGIVVRLTDSSPVATRPLLRLARPQPVLNATQIELAAWIAAEYVAPVAETIKLFLPPGMLQRSPDKLGVQAKRQLWVELAVPAVDTHAALDASAVPSPALRVISWFLDHPDASPTAREVQAACQLKSKSAIDTLIRRGALAGDQGVVRARVGRETLLDLARAERGGEGQRRAIDAIDAAGGGMWKEELALRAPVTLAQLRRLRDRGIVRLEERVRFRDPLQGRTFVRTQMPALTGEQAAAWQIIAEDGFTEQAGLLPRHFLLHGVTGSGKTEIYLRAIGETLRRGRQAIVLIPEIALAPQTVARFAGRFPGRVTVIHSALNQGERYDVWRSVRAGELDIVVGPRSALFAPLPSLGLIVIDEEHESSYKQDSEEWGSLNVFYDARAVARKLATMTGSVLIAGSATPSLESYSRAMRGEMTMLELPRRVMGHGMAQQAVEVRGAGEPAAPDHTAPDHTAPDHTVPDHTAPEVAAAGTGGLRTSNREAAAEGQPVVYNVLPPVEIVDMRQELRAGNRSIFSRSLQAELHATLDAGEQAILFLNRRGSHTFILCRDCGHVEECPRCEVPLVYHERSGVLLCHHCERTYPIPETCPQCGGRRIRYFGSGTEQIEQRVREIAPRARLLRWDADTTSRRGSHEHILARFAAHEADVLVGTQMIAKGLDLPLVTLVGVIAADVGLHLPDFRAAERTFQLLTQVAGRAGRSARGGRVVIQSYTPEHYSIQAAAEHDYHAFYRREIAFRREHGYPPIRRMARLVLWEKNEKKARDGARRMAQALRDLIQNLNLGDETRVLGPAPAFFARTRGFYRWQLLVSAEDPPTLLRYLEIPFGWRVDVDPVSVL